MLVLSCHPKVNKLSDTASVSPFLPNIQDFLCPVETVYNGKDRTYCFNMMTHTFIFTAENLGGEMYEDP